MPLAPAMHIGINAQLLSFSGTYRAAGLSKHIAGLLAALVARHDDIRYTIYTGPGAAAWPSGFARSPRLRRRSTRWPTHKPELRIIWEQTALPLHARSDRLDLLHCPVLVRPLLCPVPTVVTVHDLAFLRYPELFPARKRFYLALLARLSARKADRLIAVSEATKRELGELLGVPPGKVTVVPNGVDLARFRPLPPAEVAAFRAAHELPERMLLYIGTLEPRKNLVNLLRAYAAVLPDLGETKLVIGGAKGWFYEEIFRTARELGLHEGRHAVRFVGYVADDDLPLWYNSATAFVYPSEYEGFGLPVLEAMACGVPVIAGAASSLPEVVGAAGLLVDTHSPAALAAALRSVLTDQELAARLAHDGQGQAAQFPWSAAAERTVGVYRDLLPSPGRR